MTNEAQTQVVPVDMFSLMDSLDDKAIVEAINGRVSKAWVYSFPQGNTTVDGLSAAGVDEAVRYLAKESHGTEVIRDIECHIDSETEAEARFIAKAGRYAVIVNKESGEVSEALLDAAVRGKRVEKIYRNGALNPHWYEHGVTKATRNAKRALLPQELEASIIEQARRGGRVQAVAQDGAPPATVTPEETTPAPPTGSAITQPQVANIRRLLSKAMPGGEREQVEWMERTQPKGVDGTRVSLGNLAKAEGSALISELKVLAGE